MLAVEPAGSAVPAPPTPADSDAAAEAAPGDGGAPPDSVDPPTSSLLGLPIPLSAPDEASLEPLIASIPSAVLRAQGLAPPPRPVLPPGYGALAPAAKVGAAQAFISGFAYNHTRGQYYDVNKARPLASLLATAASVVRRALPIKCVEATFLALLLTQGDEALDRVPVSFKSLVEGKASARGRQWGLAS